MAIMVAILDTGTKDFSYSEFLCCPDACLVVKELALK